MDRYRFLAFFFSFLTLFRMLYTAIAFFIQNQRNFFTLHASTNLHYFNDTTFADLVSDHFLNSPAQNDFAYISYGSVDDSGAIDSTDSKATQV